MRQRGKSTNRMRHWYPTTPSFCHRTKKVTPSGKIRTTLRLFWHYNVPPFVPIHRRRLPVVMVRLKMSQTLSQAATFIEQGHVRVGPHAVTDPAVSAQWTETIYEERVSFFEIGKTVSSCSKRSTTRSKIFSLFGSWPKSSTARLHWFASRSTSSLVAWKISWRGWTVRRSSGPSRLTKTSWTISICWAKDRFEIEIDHVTVYQNQWEEGGGAGRGEVYPRESSFCSVSRRWEVVLKAKHCQSPR